MVDMKKRDFVPLDKKNIGVYYPESDIHMYDMSMTPIDRKCGYKPLRRGFINFMRKNSGLCAVVNDGTLRGVMGPAEMIDYINANELHGPLDGIFMGGSVNAVRSRIEKVEKLTGQFAEEAIRGGKKFRLYEAGSGFLRIPINIIDSLKSRDLKPELFYVGVEKDKNAAEAALKIADFEGISDKIDVHLGDALEILRRMDDEFDCVLVEGAMEYWSPHYCKAFAEESYRHLKKGGRLVSTATHVIPKEKMARVLDLYFEPKSESEFIEMYTESGFEEPVLFKTNPPNISVGVGKKK